MAQRDVPCFLYYRQSNGVITFMNLDGSEQIIAKDWATADLLAHMSALNHGQDEVIAITATQLKDTLQ